MKQADFGDIERWQLVLPVSVLQERPQRSLKTAMGRQVAASGARLAQCPTAWRSVVTSSNVKRLFTSFGFWAGTQYRVHVIKHSVHTRLENVQLFVHTQ